MESSGSFIIGTLRVGQTLLGAIYTGTLWQTAMRFTSLLAPVCVGGGGRLPVALTRWWSSPQAINWLVCKIVPTHHETAQTCAF